ncbi:MAG TPA: hypothetical protein PLB10_17870 [Thiolinea sp.]|nr:hypothetical protein [Thiolinea sp.]
MGKWLDRLLDFENTQSSHSQNTQKVEKGAFVSFESGHSGPNKKYPAVWQVVLSGSGCDYPMTVIDPNRLPDDKFIQYLSDKFGSDRVVSASRRQQQYD